MTDQTPDPRDDLLRDALHAEAQDITADAELLARIQAAAAEQPSGRSPGRWRLVAAAVALVAGLGITLLNQDDDQVVDSANDPSSTTTSTTTAPGTDLYDALAGAFPCDYAGRYQTVYFFDPGGDLGRASDEEVAAIGAALDADPRAQSARYVHEAEVTRVLTGATPGVAWNPDAIPSGYLATFRTSDDDLAVRAAVSDLPGIAATISTDCSDNADPPESRPTLVALVREDGMLVTIDLTSGEEKELYSAGDPREEVEEGGPQFIDAVDVSPDGDWIYFSTCCEPASGTVFRIPTDGGDVEQVSSGAYPRVSPDGRFVARADSVAVYVGSTAGSDLSTPLAQVPVECCASRLAWSLDGTRLALVQGTGAGGEAREVLLFAWDGSSLAAADLGKPENPGSFVSWQPNGTPVISSGGPMDDERSLAQDRTYRWLLWVDEEGVVREQAGQESSDRTPIDGLPKAIAADW